MLHLSDFDYVLPKENIAQTPLAQRDQSRLLVMDRDTGDIIGHKHFYDIVDYLEPGDLLVVNETKVNALRLLGKRASGGAAEVFLTHRIAEGLWQALVKPGKSLMPGSVVFFERGLKATILNVADARGGRTVQFDVDGATDGVEAVMDLVGRTPLPPYIIDDNIEPEHQAQLRRRYQTVYAKSPGSAAAPTAGLHFTPELMNKIQKKGVGISKLSLHVGVGTFLPIVSDDISEHKMHSESVTIPSETADAIKSAKGRIIGVGTTVLRALESAAEGYRNVRPGSFDTNLFVTPGFEFKIVDSLITNFHMPKSTLVVLVSAFSSREGILAAYNEALCKEYRFLSFGDAMFIHRLNMAKDT